MQLVMFRIIFVSSFEVKLSYWKAEFLISEMILNS
jgi:hypothetical protein